MMQVSREYVKYHVAVPDDLILEEVSMSMGHTEVRYRHKVVYATVDITPEGETSVRLYGYRVGKRGLPRRGGGIAQPIYGVYSLINHEDGKVSSRDETEKVRAEVLAAVESYRALKNADAVLNGV